jgi:hypothetical protein
MRIPVLPLCSSVAVLRIAGMAELAAGGWWFGSSTERPGTRSWISTPRCGMSPGPSGGSSARRALPGLAAAADTLDFSQPVAVIMLGITAHVNDDAEARSIVHRITGALPPGSYLTLT